MFKQTVVYPQHGILLSHKEEWIGDTSKNWDGVQGIMPHEKSQAPNVPYHMILFI